jgi:hypothetical protein
VNLEIDRVVDVRTQRDECGIEALCMTYLQNRNTSLAAAIIDRLRRGFVKSAFRLKTWIPVSSNPHAISQCDSVGTARLTASTLPMSVRQSVLTPVFLSLATLRARAASRIAHGYKVARAFRGKRRVQTCVLRAEVTDSDDCGAKHNSDFSGISGQTSTCACLVFCCLNRCYDSTILQSLNLAHAF